jgi:steroid delta-isomerase-like uncharacterized protein
MNEDIWVPVLVLIEQGVNGSHLNTLDTVLSPDLVVRAPLISPGGREGFKQFFADLRRGFPDAYLRVQDFVSSRDTIYWRWTLEGTQEEDFYGIPSSGRRIEVDGVSIDRIDRGVIVEHWSFWDPASLARQLRGDTNLLNG